MSDTVYVALIGFMAAIAGGVLQAWAQRNFDVRKAERQTRAEAYLTYLQGISDLSFASTQEAESAALSMIADARGRIALSGSAGVVTSMVASFDFGSDLHSPQARAAHGRVIEAMRADSQTKLAKVDSEDLFILLYGKAGPERKISEQNSVSESGLPEPYPLVNATTEEIRSWLAADAPPYDQMRVALPWLTDQHQLQAWLKGMRMGRCGDFALPENVFSLPLPHRRVEGGNQ